MRPPSLQSEEVEEGAVLPKPGGLSSRGVGVSQEDSWEEVVDPREEGGRQALGAGVHGKWCSLPVETLLVGGR